MKYTKNSEIVIDLVKEKISKLAMFIQNGPAFWKAFGTIKNDKWIIKMSLENFGSEEMIAD